MLEHFRHLEINNYPKILLVHLITTSAVVLNGKELGLILGLDPRSFLSHFRDSEELYREKFNRRYVYFSVDEVKYKQQRQRRQQLEATSTLPTDAEAVMVLVEYIRYPRDNSEQLSNRLTTMGFQVSAETIDNLFKYHDLIKKT